MTRHFRLARNLVVAIALIMIGVSSAEAAKKFTEKPREGQAGLLFVNQESEIAYGLVVNLSNKAIVVTDPSTGFAGPFQNIRGKGTTRITFSHPDPAIPPSTDAEGGVNLIFRSYKAGLEIKTYWWVDAEGKRIGEKNSP